MTVELRAHPPPLEQPVSAPGGTVGRRAGSVLARPGVTAVVFLLIAAHLLWPVLRTPFAGDDIQGSQIRSHVETTEEGTRDLIERIHTNWVRAEGRFFPVAVAEGVLLFWAVQDREVYKAMQLAAPLVIMVLVGALVSLLTRDRWTGVLAMGFLVPLFQFRRGYDPITQFSLQQPSVSAKILGSLILLVLALRAPTWRRFSMILGVAVLLWVLALMHYETTYPLTVIPIAVVLLEAGSERLRRRVAVAAIALPTLMLAGYVIHLRSEAPPVKAPGYTIRLDPDRMVGALGPQVTAALPMSYPVLEGGEVPRVSTAFGDAKALSLVAGLALPLAGLVAVRRSPTMTRRAAQTLVGVGGTLLLAPAAVISTSVRWQHELNWGNAYIPVFQQSLGLAILLTGVVGGVRRWARGGLRATVATGVVVLIGLVFALAVPVTRVVNDWAADGGSASRRTREAFDEAVRDGLLDDLAGRAALSPHADGVLWFNGEYVEWLGGPERVPFAPVVATGARPCGRVLCTSDGKELWYVTDWSNTDGLYVLWTAPIANLAGDGSNPAQVLVDLGRARARAHVDGDPITLARPVAVQAARGSDEPVIVPGRRVGGSDDFGVAGLAVPVTAVSFQVA